MHDKQGGFDFLRKGSDRLTMRVKGGKDEREGQHDGTNGREAEVAEDG